MADKSRYTNVSLAKTVHEGLQEISKRKRTKSPTTIKRRKL